MRYKLRSSKQARLSEPRDSTSSLYNTSTELESSGEPETMMESSGDTTNIHLFVGPSPPVKRKMTHRRKTQSKALEKPQSEGPSSELNIFSLPQEVILILVENLDLESALAMLRLSRWFYSMLQQSDSYWRLLCMKTEFSNHSCLEQNPQPRLGWAGQNMYLDRCAEELVGTWRQTWRRGIKMRRNVVTSNFQGWRLFSNSNCPVTELMPGLDMNTVKQRLGQFPKLLHNDDLKIDWDDKHLVLFHFFRGQSESCTIRIWDIEDEPKFLYEVNKGIECITDKVSVSSGHVVIVPSWPLEARAIVMTLDINNKMEEAGKYLFSDEASQTALDDNWEHTQLRVVRGKAMVVCRAPTWRVIITSLPDCLPLSEILLTQICNLYECQQIRSYKGTAVILFTKTKASQVCSLVTMDVNDTESKVRSCHATQDVTDVALYTDPEEIYLMKKSGDVILYDATKKQENVKISNVITKQAREGAENCDYQLFVNGKEQICVVQSAPEAGVGRSINVFSYCGKWMYEINLDLYRYGLSRDESVCIYTNAAFLAAADSKRFVLFNVRNGKFVGILQIPTHLERNKGKEEKDCMYEQTGLGLFIFDENRLIAVHDYERSFPAVLDIYKFW